ncbi:cyclase family protein [Mariniblastus sp.]|nr:cyclase family protein [Mariniblastus sp.]
MNIEFDNEGHRYLCDLASGVSLVSPVRFDKADSNPWNADAASKSPVTIGDFVGSTQSGGSCNVDQLSMIPHCHGTHTETIGHIVDGDHFVSDLSIPSLIPAVVVSVSAIMAESTSDTYLPSFGQSQIDRASAVDILISRVTATLDNANLVALLAQHYTQQ